MFKVMLLAILMSLYTPIRPPAHTPVFPYDPNRVSSEILGSAQEAPGTMFWSTIKATEPDGEGVVMIATVDPNTATFYLAPTPTTIVDPADPNGVSRIHEWVWQVRSDNTEVVYIHFTGVDPNGMTDERDIVVNFAPLNRPPVLSGWGGPTNQQPQ